MGPIPWQNSFLPVSGLGESTDSRFGGKNRPGGGAAPPGPAWNMFPWNTGWKGGGACLVAYPRGTLKWAEMDASKNSLVPEADHPVVVEGHPVLDHPTALNRE